MITFFVVHSVRKFKNCNVAVLEMASVRKYIY